MYAYICTCFNIIQTKTLINCVHIPFTHTHTHTHACMRVHIHSKLIPYHTKNACIKWSLTRLNIVNGRSGEAGPRAIRPDDRPAPLRHLQAGQKPYPGAAIACRRTITHRRVFGTQTGQDQHGQQRQRHGLTPHTLCYRYNEGKCKFSRCRYRHA